MLQRTIVRASQQAARPLSRKQASYAPVRSQAWSTRAAPAGARWYSEAPAAKEGESAEGKTSEQSSQASKESAQLKEQIEKKDKEIVDLKASSKILINHKLATNIR